MDRRARSQGRERDKMRSIVHFNELLNNFVYRSDEPLKSCHSLYEKLEHIFSLYLSATMNISEAKKRSLKIHRFNSVVYLIEIF